MVEVTRGGKVVHRIFAGYSQQLQGSGLFGTPTLSHLQFAFHSLIPGDRPQVVIRLWSGGKNCCHYHWVLGTQPSLGVLLDTKRFHFDDLSEVVDLDGDGLPELRFAPTTFDYFGGSYANSPRPQAWFRFNRATQRYEPANDLLFPYLKEGYGKALQALPTLQQHLTAGGLYEELGGDVTGLVLHYLYAGRDNEAWSIHESRYPYEDVAGWRKAVELRLASDPFYQELRTRMKRDGR